jgi:hypothetical protein
MEKFAVFGVFNCRFGIFSPILVCCTKKNLASLVYSAFNQCDQMTWWRGPVLSPSPATEDSGAMGREIGSPLGIEW